MPGSSRSSVATLSSSVPHGSHSTFAITASVVTSGGVNELTLPRRLSLSETPPDIAGTTGPGRYKIGIETLWLDLIEGALGFSKGNRESVHTVQRRTSLPTGEKTSTKLKLAVKLTAFCQVYHRSGL
jgi:hypothetical protein